jgi:benzoyl-CoA reductase/2-hydroxyglutaryl-CoA dehydratase subunit BcrC/BadD/HgdB
MPSTPAIAELTAGFGDRFNHIGRHPGKDRAVVLMSWPSVPVEIVRACGLEPVVALGGSRETPAADSVLEPGLFPGRLRALVEKALTGEFDAIAAIVLPRTSDADYKCFLYLREFLRRGIVKTLPPILLFDLLHSINADVPAYDAERTREFFDQLKGLSGVKATIEDLQREIALADAGRAAARRIIALRLDNPRVSGCEALPLLGAFWQLPPKRYTELADVAAEELAERSPLRKPRVLLVGVPVDSPAAHEAIEAADGVVVGEVTPFGSGVAGDDVGVDGDPIRALADKYRRDSIDARLPVQALRRRMESLLAAVDAVLVSLPPYDAVFGWDYPALGRLLDQHSIPHAVVESDPAQGLTAAEHERITALVAAASQTKASRNG